MQHSCKLVLICKSTEAALGWRPFSYIPRLKVLSTMIRKNPRGDIPVIDPSAFVDPTAILCGRVEVRANVFIGPYAVIRADEVDADGHMEPIIIGAHSNIQDGVVIHSKSGAAVNIGERTSIAHRAIVHGPCQVGDGVFIGFNSVLFNCTIGDGCVIRHNAVVDGCRLPADFYVPSTERIGPRTELSSIPKVSAQASEFSEDVARTNNELVQGYKRIQNEFLGDIIGGFYLGDWRYVYVMDV